MFLMNRHCQNQLLQWNDLKENLSKLAFDEEENANRELDEAMLLNQFSRENLLPM